jgi:SAM-dependent methyltransferase
MNGAAAAYEGEAGLRLLAGYEAVSAPDLHGPVADLIPLRPVCVLDVGAGSGRDAAWLAGLGHQVLAVEPSATFRAEGVRLHPDPKIAWIADHLPDLTSVRAQTTTFGVILLSAVWQHVAPKDRPTAFRTLAGLLAPGGNLLISLRLGPPDLARDMHPVSVSELCDLAAGSGLAVVREAPLPDRMGRSEISWITVALSKAVRSPAGSDAPASGAMRA